MTPASCCRCYSTTRCSCAPCGTATPAGKAERSRRKGPDESEARRMMHGSPGKRVTVAESRALLGVQTDSSVHEEPRRCTYWNADDKKPLHLTFSPQTSHDRFDRTCATLRAWDRADRTSGDCFPKIKPLSDHPIAVGKELAYPGSNRAADESITRFTG